MNPVRAKTYPPIARNLLRGHRAYVSESLTNRVTMSEILLRQIFEWTRDKVGAFDILIGDYFHRHNLEDLDGLGEPGALQRAIADGKALAQKTQSVLDSLAFSEVATRFAGDICAGPRFEERLRAQLNLYETNERYGHYINVATDVFLRRFAPARVTADAARRHSRLYQLEELAMFELLSGEGYSVNVYSGAHLPVMKEIVAGTLRGALPTLETLTLVELTFRTR